MRQCRKVNNFESCPNNKYFLRMSIRNFELNQYILNVKYCLLYISDNQNMVQWEQLKN